jgi:hypothetical protein
MVDPIALGKMRMARRSLVEEPLGTVDQGRKKVARERVVGGPTDEC